MQREHVPSLVRLEINPEEMNHLLPILKHYTLGRKKKKKTKKEMNKHLARLMECSGEKGRGESFFQDSTIPCSFLVLNSLQVES